MQLERHRHRHRRSEEAKTAAYMKVPAANCPNYPPAGCCPSPVEQEEEELELLMGIVTSTMLLGVDVSTESISRIIVRRLLLQLVGRPLTTWRERRQLRQFCHLAKTEKSKVNCSAVWRKRQQLCP
jgi:hypothetical protein